MPERHSYDEKFQAGHWLEVMEVPSHWGKFRCFSVGVNV